MDEYIISDEEAKKVAKLYNEIQDKRISFEEYLYKYKKEQMDKILTEEKRDERDNKG